MQLLPSAAITCLAAGTAVSAAGTAVSTAVAF